MRKPRRQSINRAFRLKLPAASDPFPTPEDIARLAHEMLVSHGRKAGTAGIVAYWRAAEAELLNRAARRLLTPPQAPRSHARPDT